MENMKNIIILPIIVHITLCNDLLIVHSGARTVSSFSQRLCIIHLFIPRA